MRKPFYSYPLIGELLLELIVAPFAALEVHEHVYPLAFSLEASTFKEADATGVSCVHARPEIVGCYVARRKVSYTVSEYSAFKFRKQRAGDALVLVGWRRAEQADARVGISGGLAHAPEHHASKLISIKRHELISWFSLKLAKDAPTKLVKREIVIRKRVHTKIE